MASSKSSYVFYGRHTSLGWFWTRLGFKLSILCFNPLAPFPTKTLLCVPSCKWTREVSLVVSGPFWPSCPTHCHFLAYFLLPPALSSVQFSCSVVSDSLWPHGLQHFRPPCPSPTPGACLNSCPLSRWCHPTISSSVVPFSSCPQSFPASGSFPMSQFFPSGGQSIGVSASSVLPMNIQNWYPLGLTGWISLQSNGLSRVFSNTTVQEYHFF